MADLAASAVTIEDSWTAGGISSKRHVEMIATLVLTGQGTTTNQILATALGLTKIERCGNAVGDGNDLIYPAVPNYAGTAILLMAVTNATDGTRAAPADITDTVRIFVSGYR